MPSNWNFSWTSGPAGFNTLVHEWQALADQLPDAQYYQRPQWFGAHLQACSCPGDLIWLSARMDSKLRAVLPLQRVVRKLGPLALSELHMITHGHMTLADVCVDRNIQGLWPEWWRWLQTRSAPDWNRIVVASTPADSIWSAWMAEMVPRHKLSSVEGSSARVDCRCSVDEVLQNCTAKFRSNIARSTKRAKAMGPFRHEYAQTPRELSRAFPVFLDIESSGWKGTAGSSVASNPETLKFYEMLVAGFGSRGECEIDLLHIGDKPAAAILWFRTARELHLQKTGYLEDMSNLSPGTLLLRETLARVCADATVDRLCFITHPEWTKPWRPESNPVLEFCLFRDSLQGKLLWWVTKARRNTSNGTKEDSGKQASTTAGAR